MGKEEMSKSTIIWTLSLSLGLICVGLLAGLICFVIMSNTYSTQLENVYKRSLYELSSNIDDMEVNISKLVATNSSDSQQKILADLYQNCVLAENNLSCLPISNQTSSDLNNFINKLGGYSYSLLDKVNKGGKVSDDEFKTIIALHDQSEIMVYQLSSYMAEKNYKFNMVKDVNFSNYDNNYLSDIGEIMGTSTEVPSLIYDGPFSDSVINKEIKGLPENVVTKEDGLAKIKQVLPQYTNVKYVNDTVGKFDVYNYTADYAGQTYYLQITKKGGILLSITANATNGTENFTEQQCVNKAETFAAQLGFENMYCVWNATSRGITYVNLAPIVNHVIYYPDLIKVKVDVSSGEIVGWEATNYCYNHVDRSYSMSINLLDAQQLVSPRLNVIERNYCIIPNEYVGESYAYEFICTWDKYTYYVYLSAENGKELNIMRVVKTSSGDLMV